MKPKASETTLQSDGIQTSVKFGIKESGLAHIFNVLRNQLYSDKILAVVREYSCNAVDAHVEVGIAEQPIEVTIPTKLKLEFKVRDFGPALTDQEIQDVYAFYGESTKRNTNEQTGMLGIGSKSAFAYGDNFVIHSFIDGEKHTYNAFIDPSQIGQISKLSKSTTREKNGIEIVIPVKEDDVDEFQIKARDLFRYFKVAPAIKGAATFEYSDKSVLFEGEDWTWYKSTQDRRSYHYNQRDSMAIMGNIGYPLTHSDLNFSDTDIEARVDDLVQENLHMKFDIGDLDIAASREKLQFTDSTRRAIIKRLYKVKKELVAKATKQFTDCESLWAAKTLLADIRDFTSGLYELREIIEKDVRWKGKEVGSTTVSAFEGVDIAEVKKPNRGIRYRFEDKSQIQAGTSVVVVENDIGHRRGIMGRLLGMAMEEQKKVNLVEFKKPAARRNWRKKFDGEMLKLSELPKRTLTDFYGSRSSGGSVTDSAHAKKLNSPAFEFDFNAANSWQNRNSDYFKPADVNLDAGGVYIILDHFKVETDLDMGYYGHEPKRLYNMKKAAEEAGVTFPKRVFAWKVAKRDVPEQADGFITLWDYIRKELKRVIKSKNLEQKWVDYVHASSNGDEWHNMNNDLKKVFRGAISATDSPLVNNMVQRDKMIDGGKAVEKIKEFASNFGVKLNFELDPSFDLEKGNKELNERYSMFKLMDWYKIRGFGSNDVQKDYVKVVANYINVIDVCDASR